MVGEDSYYIMIKKELKLNITSGRLGQKIKHLQFATLEMRRQLEPKCVSQLFLVPLLGTRRSAIGQFFPVPSNSPEVFAKVNSARFLLVSKVAHFVLKCL